jgi:hypothetical protein
MRNFVGESSEKRLYGGQKIKEKSIKADREDSSRKARLTTLAQDRVQSRASLV